nr:DUF1566 domain-containing protein [Desulfobulbaceae bacterium]
IGSLKTMLGVLSLVLVLVSSAQAATYIDNKDGTIFDAQTNLIWQQADDGTERIWTEAVKYCEGLELAGYSDWLLPKIFMLEGLIDSGQSPTIDPIFSIKPSYYWSSSESPTSVKSAKYVNFFYGNTYAYSKDNTYYALCVRDSSADKASPLVADFTYSKGAQESTVQFTAEISGGSEPFFREWDFGDGDTSSMSNPSHDFHGEGAYTITLTVSDNGGSIAVSTKKIVLPLAEIVEVTAAVEGSAERPPEETAVQESAAVEVTDGVGGSDPVPEQSADLQHVESDLALFDAASQQGMTTTDVVSSSTLSEQDLVVASDVVEDAAPGSEMAEGDVDEPADEAPLVADQIDSEPATDAGTTITEPEVALSIPDTPVEQDTVETPEGVTTSLEVVDLPKKRSVLQIFAARQLPLVDPGGFGHQLLAYAFANAVKGDADLNKDSQVTAYELKGYLTIAMESLSEGKQNPVISIDGDSFPLCSATQSTFAFVVGVDTLYQGAGQWPYAAESAELVRKSIEESCQKVQTISLSAEHANRQGVLQALMQIKSLIQPQDSLVFYFAGKSDYGSDGRLILSLFDTVPEMSSLTGLYYSVVLGFIDTITLCQVTLLLETSAPRADN